MAKRGRNHRRGNGKIDHHGLPIPSKVGGIEEFIRLINSRFPHISGDIRSAPALQGFVSHFLRPDPFNGGEEKFSEVIDFWSKAMPNRSIADKAVARFIRVAAQEVREKAPPENLELMTRITGMRLF